MRSSAVQVRIDLSRIRRNVEQIRLRTGVEVIAVVKADAYGVGAARVAEAIGDIVNGFYTYTSTEAIKAHLWERTGKPTLALDPQGGVDVDVYRKNHIRPAVWTAQRAQALKEARPVLCVDTGMQRFSCPLEQAAEVLAAGECDEAFTHAVHPDQAGQLAAGIQSLALSRAIRLHAAGTALLDEPQARLDAVRPGLAMYAGAVRVTTPLVEARDTRGPVGYGRFQASRIGVILCGYSNGLRPGPCRINDRPTRVLEVGMQSAYVELVSGENAGDLVTLLDERTDMAAIGQAWTTSPQEALLRFCGSGRRTYVV